MSKKLQCCEVCGVELSMKEWAINTGLCLACLRNKQDKEIVYKDLHSIDKR